jgi:intracellular sulfur oxidation DsrE/DsrF family protein
MSEGYAKKLKLKKEDVLKEFMDNLLPGIQLVPSGIWALNHAQELGCKFCFGG